MNQNVMTKISSMVPAILLVATFVSGTILFYSSQAVSEHNEKEDAHPNLIRAMDAISSKVDLLEQQVTLSQKRTDEKFIVSEKNQERILNAVMNNKKDD